MKILMLLRANFLMLLRQRALLLSSLGLAVISILVFGYLFGGNGTIKTVIGVVDQDHSTVSAQITSQLQKSDALKIYTGNAAEEQQALKDGQRDAVILIPAGFGQQLVQGNARLQVFYDQGNAVTAATTQLTIKAIIDDINRQIMHQPGTVTLDQQGVAVTSVLSFHFATAGMLRIMVRMVDVIGDKQLGKWREKGMTEKLVIV